MNKLIKQKTAYALALLLGLVSVFGGTAFPLPSSPQPSVVHAAVTPVTYQPNSPWTVNIKNDGTYHFYNNNDDDTLTIKSNGEKYYSTKGGTAKRNTGSATFYDDKDGDYTGSHIEVKFSGFSSLKPGQSGTLTVESTDQYTLDSPVTVNVKARSYTIENRGSMTAGKRYSAICGPTYETHYSFTPASSGNYIVAYTGEYWAMYIDHLISTSSSEGGQFLTLVGGGGNDITATSDSTKIGSSGAYKHSCKLAGGFTYDVTSDYDNDFETDTTVYFGIFPEGTSNDTILSVLGVSDTSSSSSNSSSSLNRNILSSTSSSSSSRSSSSSSSSSSSFSKGDSETGGSGSSKADYVKTGTNTVRYDASQVSSKATKATVPATVKIDGKTYKVTTISAEAFAGNTKIKETTIGKNVKKIAEGAVNGCKNLKTLTVRSKNFTKKGVQGALKGANVKSIGVPPSKVDAYKNIFTKSNTKNGSKPNVKANKPKNK